MLANVPMTTEEDTRVDVEDILDDAVLAGKPFGQDNRPFDICCFFEPKLVDLLNHGDGFVRKSKLPVSLTDVIVVVTYERPLAHGNILEIYPRSLLLS